MTYQLNFKRKGGRPKGSKSWRDWKTPYGKIFQHVAKVANGEVSLRSVFYDLCTMELLKFAISDYTSLSHYTGKWRDERKLAPDCFSDTTRWVIEPDNWNPKNYIYSYTPAEYIVDRLNYIRYAPDRYYESILHRWDKQPNYVEVWLEKYTMAPVLRRPCDEKKVLLVPNRGFSSKTFAYLNFERLGHIWNYIPGTIYIQYYGDDDKSGHEIEEALKREQRRHNMDETNVKFERIAVTEEQVTEYQLPRIDGKIELEALYNHDKSGFEYMIGRTIDERFDKNLYKKMLSNVPSKEEIKQIVIEQTERLLEKLKNN